MKDISTLVSDISKLFEGHTLDELLAKKFGEEFTTILSKRFKEYGDERKGTLRLSNIGWPLRRLWYHVRDIPKEKLSASAKVKFLYGDLIEALFILLAIEAGHSVECLQKEVEVEGIVGHIDCLVDGVLVDFKSCSTFSFNKFRSGDLYENDPFGYVYQLQSYRVALDVPKAGWFIIDKTLGHFDYVECKSLSLNVPKKIQEVKKGTASEVEPSYCYSPKKPTKDDKTGNLILDVGCSYCEYKFHCWRDSNDGKGLQERIYSTGPKYFTTIKKEPRLKYNNNYESFDVKEEV